MTNIVEGPRKMPARERKTSSTQDAPTNHTTPPLLRLSQIIDSPSFDGKKHGLELVWEL